jgi:KDO2-lipid IV(A) lauroyltransferase
MTRTLLQGALWALGQCPLPLLHALGWALGNLLWLTPNEYRRITLRHLELCLPERSPRERERLARRSLIESAKAVCEAPALWFGAERRLRRWLHDPAALEALRGVCQSGRGTIVLTPHLGAWELASFFVAQAGPLTVLYKPQKGAAEAVIRRGRSRLPQIHPVPTTGRGVKALLGALRKSQAVGILPDHDPPEESGSRYAPLFGIPAHTMDLVSRLAAKSGAPVWFVVVERLSWGRGFRFHLRRAPAGIDDAQHGPEALNAGVEACIRLLPEQYWWSYRRFRRRPPGSGDLYARRT